MKIKDFQQAFDAADGAPVAVIYRPPHLRRNEAGEQGVISSMNSSVVFVRFGSNPQAQACYPTDLELLRP